MKEVVILLCLLLTACADATRTIPVPKIVIEDYGINLAERPRLTLPPAPIEQYELPPPR